MHMGCLLIQMHYCGEDVVLPYSLGEEIHHCLEELPYILSVLALEET